MRNCIITTCESDCKDFMELYAIFTATLYPGMSFRKFRAFYYSKSLDYIDVTFMYSAGRQIGFYAAAFYRTTISDRPVVIGRAATGVLPGERGGKLPVWSLYAKYMRYKLRHPLAGILLTAYVANPLVYAMICKYTGIVYPRLSVDVNGEIIGLKDSILQHGNLKERELSPFVVKIHFKVQLGEDIIRRSLESNNVFVRYYLSINPHFQEQNGVLTIVPVTWENVLRSCARLTKAWCGKNKWWRSRPAGKAGEKAGSAEQQENLYNFPKQNHRAYYDEAVLSNPEQ
ncbi:MAG: hypothetical protein INR73_06245 [Williamsia sp.]|nr:hypothetical protein [Williamsia sp.]